MKKNVKVLAVALLMCNLFILTGCSESAKANEFTETETTTEIQTESVDNLTLAPQARTYDESELSDSYEEYSTITLKDSASTTDDSSVEIDGDIITITQAGTYEVSGTLTDGQIVIDTKDDSKVQLVLSGVDITNSTNSPIYVKKAKDYAMITLKEGTFNTLTDSETYVLPESTDGEEVEDLDATIYSKDDLVINGTGSLTVNANYNDGVKSNDTLLIENGNITVNAIQDAIYGKDSLTVNGGNIDIVTFNGSADAEMKVEEFGAGMGKRPDMNGDFTGTPPDMNGDFTGIPPEFNTEMDINQDMENSGFMPVPPNMIDSVEQGTKENNGMTDTEEAVDVVETTEEEDTGSHKGLKSGGEIVINGGTFVLDTYDDGLNANTFIEINGGDFDIKSGDDAIKAEYLLTINDGNIDISYCYEGVESKELHLNGGNINIVSVDDGINASDPNSETTMGMPYGSDEPLTEEDPVIYVDGSNIIVNGSGDAIDSNGGIIMNSGTVIIHGVNNGGELALDFDKHSVINGGSLLVLGGTGNLSSESLQNVVIAPLSTTYASGTELQILDENNNVIFETTLERDTTSVTFSSDDIEQGKTYTLTNGVSSTEVTTSTDSVITGSTQSFGGRGQRPDIREDASTSTTTK